MHRSSVDDWIRFYDEVIVRGADWAPEAWFAAVEQAMAGALPADSPLLDTYRRRVEELLALDRAGGASEEDERRISALEAEIQRLIGAADEVIRTRRTVPARTNRIRDVVEAPLQVRPRQSFLRAALTTALVLVLMGAGLLAALYLYDARVAMKVDQELDRYAADLKTTVARLQAELEAQMGHNQSEQERLQTLQGEVAADLAAFEREVDDSMVRMTTLAADASRELERRLAELPPDREVVAYCRGPYCVMALQAVDMLRSHGFHARRLDVGLPDWRAQGHAVMEGSASTLTDNEDNGS